MPHAAHRTRTVRSRLGTDFGQVLVRVVLETPGGVASVLSDEAGDAIDFAHDPVEISEIDVQLLGAQVGQSIVRTHMSARRHRMVEPAVLIETDSEKLMVAAAADVYIVALLLERRANVAAAMRVFSLGRRVIERLLLD